MRTSSEIKKNNIRKANLMMESNTRRNKGNVATQFGLYEQCGVDVSGRDLDGEYMGAPVGTEPIMDTGLEMGFDEMEFIDDDDVLLDPEMMMFMMEDRKKVNEGSTDCCGFGCPNPVHCHYGCCDGECCDADQRPDGGGPLGKTHAGTDYEGVDHSDRDDFDGRKSRVVGVDSDIKKQRELKENYRALTAQPSRDSWGNKYNKILTESNQVNGVNSLIKRMRKVIR